MNFEKPDVHRQEPANTPLDRAQKFLRVLAVALPALMADVSVSRAQESALVPDFSALTNVMEVVADIQRMRKEESEHARQLGPEVFSAYQEYQKLADVIWETSFELKKLRRLVGEAQEIEGEKTSIKPDLAEGFRLKYGTTPTEFIKRALVDIGKFETVISGSEPLKDAALDRYLILEGQALQQKSNPRN